VNWPDARISSIETLESGENPRGRGRWSDFRLDSFLPAAVEKQAFLGREAEPRSSHLPSAKTPRSSKARAQSVSRGPGTGRNERPRGKRRFRFLPSGSCRRFGLHFEEDKVAKTFLVQTPRRGEPGDASADDDNSDFLNALGSGKSRMIRSRWPRGNPSLTNCPSMRFSALAVKADEAERLTKESSARRHLFSVASRNGSDFQHLGNRGEFGPLLRRGGACLRYGIRWLPSINSRAFLRRRARRPAMHPGRSARTRCTRPRGRFRRLLRDCSRTAYRLVECVMSWRMHSCVPRRDSSRCRAAESGIDTSVDAARRGVRHVAIRICDASH